MLKRYRWDSWIKWLKSRWISLQTRLSGSTARTLPQQAGQRAEEIALAHLRRAGLTLVARNVRCKGGELDLIMQDGTTVVFVEVRFRANVRFGGALASINTSKQQRFLRCAQQFLRTHPLHRGQGCRFDVVALEGSLDQPQVTWICAAFH